MSKIYKYQGTNEYHFDSLKNNTFRVSGLSSLNDPCEFKFSEIKINTFLDNLDTELLGFYTRGEFTRETPICLISLIKTKGYHFNRKHRRTMISLSKTHTAMEVLEYFKVDVISIKNSLERDYNRLIEIKNKLGVFSLTYDPLNTTMWAHYANNHKGFVIEYDVTKLPNSQSAFDITYSTELPILELDDLIYNSQNDSHLGEKKALILIRKMFGTKLKQWENEQEHRLLYFDPDSNHKYPSNAVTSIYFGLHMTSEHKINIQEIFKESNVTFYQIQHKKDSYELEAIPYK